MTTDKTNPAPMVDASQIEWVEHPRLPGIFIKPLLKSTDNPRASVNLVRVPAGSVINPHNHPDEIETVYVLSGKSVLILGDKELPFNAGQIVAIPSRLQHALRTVGSEDVQLITYFTPPIS